MMYNVNRQPSNEHAKNNSICNAAFKWVTSHQTIDRQTDKHSVIWYAIQMHSTIMAKWIALADAQNYNVILLCSAFSEHNELKFTRICCKLTKMQTMQ